MIPYYNQFSTLYCIRPYSVDDGWGNIIIKNDYTTDTISFSGYRISDSSNSLPIYEPDTYIQVSGSTYNNRNYKVVASTTSYIDVDTALTTELVGANITITNKWAFLGNIQEMNAKHQPVLEGEMYIGDYKLFSAVDIDIKVLDRIFDGTNYYEVISISNKTNNIYMDAYKYCVIKRGEYA